MKQKKRRKKQRRAQNGYADRARSLRTLGFHSYAAYLKSDLWQQIRQRVFEIDPICRVCTSREATQVHHMRYTLPVLRGDEMDALIAICAGCHYRIEFKNGEKRKFNRAISSTRKRLRNVDQVISAHRDLDREMDEMRGS